MAFSEATKRIIYKHAGGRCECISKRCTHPFRCIKILNISPQQQALANILGYGISYLGFEFHHINSAIAGGADTPQNGSFLCKGCHQNTPSFGNNLTRS